MNNNTECPQMAALLAPQKKGVAQIEHITITKEQADMARLRSCFNAGRIGNDPPAVGTHAVLKVGGELMMSDTRMERRTNYPFLFRAKGRVLVAGLGLGMILHPLLDNPAITHITVVEKYQDVIDLVGPTLVSPKLQIVCADINNWQPPKGEVWDTIYFDIWPTISPDNLPEMTYLHRRFARRKAPGGWMGSWLKGELERQVKRDKQRYGL